MKENIKLFLKVLVFSLIIFLPFEFFLYYYIQNLYGVKTSYYVGFLAQNIIFFILGTISFVICLNFYKLLRTKKEISMVGFLLKPEEMTENSKLIYHASLLGVIGWSIYLIALIMFLDLIPNSVNKRTLEMIADIYLFASIFFAITILFTFNRWLKRLKKYV
jgi:hypothetical protein